MGFETYMQDILRNVSSALLVPVMVVLAAFCVYALYCIGSVITEAIMQRRHYKENIPRFINSIEAAPAEDVKQVIQESGMLEPHKRVLLEAADNMSLSATDLYALAAREEELLEEHYSAVTARTDQVAKLAPMFGLMGTLIPLGPGIVALGIGDTETLSSSLLVAFDTTVAGLASGAVCSVVGRIRKSWYKKYTDAVHAAMTCILDKAQALRTKEEPGLTAQQLLEAQEQAVECIHEAEAIIESAETASEPERQPVVTTIYPKPAHAAWNAEWEQRLYEASPTAPAPTGQSPSTVAPTGQSPSMTSAPTGQSPSLASVGAGLPAQHPEPTAIPEPEPTPEPDAALEPTDEPLLAGEPVTAVMPKANRAPEPIPEPDAAPTAEPTAEPTPERTPTPEPEPAPTGQSPSKALAPTGPSLSMTPASTGSSLSMTSVGAGLPAQHPEPTATSEPTPTPTPEPEPDALALTFDAGFSLPDRRA